jgi:hypothetical protein
MAYSDANFQYTNQDTIIGGGPGLGVNLGTVTASATQTYTGTAGTSVNGAFRFPVFKVPVKIGGIRIYGVTAAGNGVSGITMNFLNGTSTIGSSTAPAAGTYADVTLTAVTVASNGAQTGPTLFTATNNEATMIVVAIGTGSGSSLGSYSIDLAWNNLFVS